MNMEIGTERNPRLFYGWWIVLAGFFVVAYGTVASGYVTRTDFLFKELGSVANKTAIALTIFSVGMTVTFLVIGPLIDKFGPRKLMLIGIPVASIALLGLGFVRPGNPNKFALIQNNLDSFLLEKKLLFSLPTSKPDTLL
jgi:MFS family permease